MAIVYIDVNPNSRFGAELTRFSRQLLNVLNDADMLKNIMTNMVDGVDYTAIETYFGLQAGQGETVFNMVNSARSTVFGSATKGLVATIR